MEAGSSRTSIVSSGFQQWALLLTYRRAWQSVTRLLCDALQRRRELRDHLAEHHPDDLAFFESVLAESEGKAAGC